MDIGPYNKGCIRQFLEDSGLGFIPRDLLWPPEASSKDSELGAPVWEAVHDCIIMGRGPYYGTIGSALDLQPKA